MTSLKNKSKFINSIDCDMAIHSWKQTEELHHAAITKSIRLKYWSKSGCSSFRSYHRNIMAMMCASDLHLHYFQAAGIATASTLQSHLLTVKQVMINAI